MSDYDGDDYSFGDYGCDGDPYYLYPNYCVDHQEEVSCELSYQTQEMENNPNEVEYPDVLVDIYGDYEEETKCSAETPEDDTRKEDAIEGGPSGEFECIYPDDDDNTERSTRAPEPIRGSVDQRSNYVERKFPANAYENTFNGSEISQAIRAGGGIFIVCGASTVATKPASRLECDSPPSD